VLLSARRAAATEFEIQNPKQSLRRLDSWPSLTVLPGPFDFAEPTSLSLLERVHLGDAEAWRRLVKLYGPMVYRWGRGAGLRTQEAEDLVQEVFFSVSQHIATFRHDRPGDSFRAWLATIARTRVCDYIRRGGNMGVAVGGTTAQERLLQVAEESISDIGPAGGRGQSVARGVGDGPAGFEDRTWRAFWRVVVDGQPAVAVADELGMTAAAVYKAKSRVLSRVRQELRGLESPEYPGWGRGFQPAQQNAVQPPRSFL